MQNLQTNISEERKNIHQSTSIVGNLKVLIKFQPTDRLNFGTNMSENKDIRWVQRLEKYSKALKSLSGDIELATKRVLTDIEKRGLIQAFEYTYELAWNTLKDFYQSIGETNIQGSRDAFRIAFSRGLVENENLIKTVKSRQMTSHAYNEEMVNEIYQDVFDKYYDAFKELEESLQREKQTRNL